MNRRKSAFRSLVCRGKQIWRYDGRTGAATAPPRSCRIVPQNQYTPLLPTPSFCHREQAARTSALSCRRDHPRVDRRLPHHDDRGGVKELTRMRIGRSSDIPVILREPIHAGHSEIPRSSPVRPVYSEVSERRFSARETMTLRALTSRRTAWEIKKNPEGID